MRPFTRAILLFDKSIHDHTYLIKVTRVVLDLVGIGLICFNELPLVVSGIILILIAEVTHQILSFFGFFAINLKKHAFRPKQYGENRIYYEGDLPILEIREKTPFKAGYAHGYLMGPYIFKMLSRTRICARVFGILHYDQVKKSLPEIKKNIPEAYLRELEGLAKGMNDWDAKHSWIYSSPITFDELLLFQLVPDMAHLTLSNLPLVGCSVIIDRDPKDHSIVIGRHLDWPSFGTYGGHTILIRRGKTISIAVPGLIGDLTVINKELFFALNVCSPKVRVDKIEVDKMPSIFLMRYLAENFHSVEMLKEAAEKNEIPLPLVPFHASAADQENAIVLHFRQDENAPLKTVIRSLPKERTVEPFTTFNNHHPTERTETHYLFFAKERAEVASAQFAKQKNALALLRVQSTLKHLPLTNNLTIQSIVYEFAQKKLYLSFDNSFAGSGPSLEIFLSSLL